MPDQRQQRAGQQQFGRQHQHQDLARPPVAVVQGLGHRDRQAVVGLPCRRHDQAGHAHRGAVGHALVAQRHPAERGRRVVRRDRLRAVADHAVVAAAHFEEHPAFAAVFEQAPGLQRQRKAGAGIVDRLGQAQRVLLQVHVVDMVGVLEHQQIEQRRDHQHQQHGRDQQERQQAPAQAGMGGGCARRLGCHGRAHDACGSSAVRDSSSR